MPKTETFQDLPLCTSAKGQERWRWLYTELRAAILDGRLRPGGRLPSTRSLADQYGISRGTVITAFDQLRAEGYTQTEVGSGTYVASGLPENFLSATRNRWSPDLPPSKATLSRRAREMLKNVEVLPAPHSVGKAFRAYEPAIDLFPVELWARTASRVIRRAPAVSVRPRQCWRQSAPTQSHLGVCWGIAWRALFTGTDHRDVRSAAGTGPDRALSVGPRRPGLDGRSGLPRSVAYIACSRGCGLFPCRWTRTGSM